MIPVFSVLFLMNCLTEYLLNSIMMRMGVLKNENRLYHGLFAALRIAWIFLGAWYGVPVPALLAGLFVLLYLNTIPYGSRRLVMNKFTMVIYLIYTTLLMLVFGTAGLLGFDMYYIGQDTLLRGIVLNATFVIFNIICSLLLHFYPAFFLQHDYEKSSVQIYTLFLFICSIYHVLDAVILTLYQTIWINYLLLVSGDILILILMFNFMKYNYVFAKSEDIKREYEESEILMAQQYFEKASLKTLSGQDSLTKACSRREICSYMAKHIENGLPLVCVFIDLDGLKRANDTYGHAFGDLMLKHFSDTCVKAMEGRGVLARIGGDEFLLVFPGGTVSEAEALIRRLQRKLLEPADAKEKISFSYGISYGETSVDAYITKADVQMYKEKNRKQRDVKWMEKP